MWDSVNPEMEGTATEVKLDEFTTKFEYPDGSVFIQVLDESEATIETVEPPKDGMITPYASIGGGSAISGSGYVVVTGAKVSGSVILAGAQYKVDYTIINGGYDTISSAYSRNITVPGPGGNYEIESWGVKKAKEDAGGKAYVSLRFKAQNSSLGASTMYLNTYVGGDKATVSSNM